MKKLFAALVCFVLTLPVSVLAQTESGAAAPTLGERLAISGRFFLGFLLVMGVIFALLLSTRRIAAWIDRQREKRQQHNK